MANLFSSVAMAFAVPFAIGLGLVGLILIGLGIHAMLNPEPSATSKTSPAPSNVIQPSSITFVVIGALFLLIGFYYPSYVRNNPNFATRVGVLETAHIFKRI